VFSFGILQVPGRTARPGLETIDERQNHPQACPHHGQVEPGRPFAKPAGTTIRKYQLPDPIGSRAFALLNREQLMFINAHATHDWFEKQQADILTYL
jgi:hypothetical protein